MARRRPRSCAWSRPRSKRSGRRRPSTRRARTMRVAVTGGTGFIGRVLLRQLAARGDEVVALVREPDAVPELAGPHVSLVRSDLRDPAVLATALTGVDALIHAAGSYKIGIPVSERPAMLDANLGTTERVLDAAIAAGVARIVYV